MNRKPPWHPKNFPKRQYDNPPLVDFSMSDSCVSPRPLCQNWICTSFIDIDFVDPGIVVLINTFNKLSRLNPSDMYDNTGKTINESLTEIRALLYEQWYICLDCWKTSYSLSDAITNQ